MIVKTYVIEGPVLNEVLKGIEQEIDTPLVVGGRRDNVIPVYEQGEEELFGRELEEEQWIQIVHHPSLDHEIYRWVLQMPEYTVEEVSEMASGVFINKKEE